MFTVLLWYVHAVMVHRSRLIRNLAQTPISDICKINKRMYRLLVNVSSWRRAGRLALMAMTARKPTTIAAMARDLPE